MDWRPGLNKTITGRDLHLKSITASLSREFEHASVLLPMHLADIAKRAKPSAFGTRRMDSQRSCCPTYASLVLVPSCLWRVSFVSPYLCHCGLRESAFVKDWVTCVCAPKDVRRIDVFSVLMRVHATASTRLVKPWARQVLHPGQYATQGGVLMALGKLAWDTELSLVGCRSLWGISLDFEKMFNMLSGLIAVEVASCMGLGSALVT